MILIADSGSTKTEWNLMTNKKVVKSFFTSGINPFYQDFDAIYKSIQNEYPDIQSITPEYIYFYGAGCANKEKQQVVKTALEKIFSTSKIEIGSDLLAAARSLCQTESGIACILGTGSNSCYYNGQSIESNVSPLGFILGDEGSGAILGKKLISDILKKQLPEPIIKRFYETYPVTPAEILDRVYKQPFPNRYLAQYTKFISGNIQEKELEKLVSDGFKDFITRNILQYPQASKVKIHVTGSIAFHFKDQLIDNLNNFNLQIGRISQAPMENLIEYHKKQH